MKGAATAFALGLAVPAEGQTVPPAPAVLDAASPSSAPGATAEGAPTGLIATPILKSRFRLETLYDPREYKLTFLSTQPRCAPAPSDEIVVCARRNDRNYGPGPRPAFPPPPTVMDAITGALTAHLGPITVGPGTDGRSVGFNMIFGGGADKPSDRMPPLCKPLAIGSTRC